MKKLLIVAVAIGLLSGCSEDFLDIKPTSKIDSRDVFQSKEAIDAFRSGMYGSINYNRDGSLFSTHLPILGDILGNDMVYGFTWMQVWNNAYSYNVGATSSEPNTLWSGLYYFQETANTLIKNDLKALDESLAKQYKAEAKAMRAYAHVSVARFFGKAYHLDNGASKALPYVDYVDYNALPARNTMAEIYAKAIKDLTEAIPDLPTSKNNEYYMNANAAHAVLAQIYADMHDYSNARLHAREAINGVALYTTSEYKNGFAKVTPGREAIMAFNTDPEKYYKWRTFNSFHDSWDGMGDDFLANSSLVSLFDDGGGVDANADIRAGFFLDERYYYKYYGGNVYGGKSYPISVLKTTAEQVKGYYTYGKFPRKDVKVGVSRGTLGTGDYIIIRASEMALLIAECDAILGDNNTEAQDILFAIESRCYPAAVKTTEVGANLLSLIKVETRKELFGEGHGIRNIKRWGDGLHRDGSQPELLDLEPNDPRFVWPVPESEINTNPNLLN